MKRIVCILVVLCAVRAVRADVGAVSPGKLASAHAALESQCNRCHVSFGGVPDAQCLSCHTQLAERNARDLGFHATVKTRPCADCHKDHKGRDAALSPPPPNPFDHRATIFPLTGQHAQLACDRCHPASGSSRQWVGIPTDCVRCHADRAHGGTLGRDCSKCHRADGWKPATRTAQDHKLSLAGGHAQLTCAGCHKSGLHLVAKQSCDQCHSQPHGGTKAPCETCHGVASWKQPTYTHTFAPERLPGKHQTAACLACHPAFRFKPTSFECSSCHDKQRPHKPLGPCADCHSAVTWQTRQFDHAKPEIGFALAGGHRNVDCKACHADNKFTPSAQKRTCESCHADVHRAQFAGKTCASCHTVDSWKPSTIAPVDHTALGFALRGKHALTPCAQCHTQGTFVGTATACASCHPDSRHRGRFGTQCESCHDETRWADAKAFDHTRTGFALDRGHTGVACARCHGGDGQRLTHVAAPTACVTCHASPHNKQYGTQCMQCHTTASFQAPVRFDHSRTGFPLELRHSTLACATCHDAKKPPASPACRSCHGDPHRGSNAIDCSTCHRADRWRVIRFDHDLTSYPLTGRHRIAPCGSCHTNPNWTGVRTDCVACHAFDRPRSRDHLTTVVCDECHVTRTWRSLHAKGAP